jgi:hypothetical protein
MSEREELIRALEDYRDTYKDQTDRLRGQIKYPQAARKTLSFRDGVLAGIEGAIQIAKTGSPFSEKDHDASR